MCPLASLSRLYHVHRRGLQQLRGTALLFSPVSPAPRRSVEASLSQTARHHLATTTKHHQTLSLTKRSARPNAAARRQLHFGLQLCHTVAALPAWYYTPRMHAAYAGHTHKAQPRRPSVHSAWPLSCLSRPSRFVPAAPALLAAPLAAVGDRESWAHIRPSAIPDLPFLQAEWS